MAYLNLLTAALALLTATADAAPASKFNFYTLPTLESGPCDMVEGPDGMLYIQNFLVDTLVKLDPSTGVTTEYPIPYNNPPALTSVLPGIGGRTAFACAIRPGKDGLIYASAGVRNEMVQLNPSTGVVKVFAQPLNNPLGDLQPFNDLWPGETGVSHQSRVYRAHANKHHQDVLLPDLRQHNLTVRLRETHLPKLPCPNALQFSTWHANCL